MTLFLNGGVQNIVTKEVHDSMTCSCTSTVIPFGYAYVACICEARRKTYFQRYQEAAELMPRSLFPRISNSEPGSGSLELSE